MREIKFRGYADQKMVKSQWLYGFGADSAEYAERYAKEIGRNRDWYLYTESGTFQVREGSIGQYTGLLDRNGKEIYEKDVLFREGYWGYYIGFEEGCFVTVPLDEVQRINWDHKPLKETDLRYWEVIGNIYEIPNSWRRRSDPMAKKKNPVLERKYQEGYEEGYEIGLDHGQLKAVYFFTHRFKGLADIPGIGKKTMEKIMNQLGHQYFDERWKG